MMHKSVFYTQMCKNKTEHMLHWRQ